MNVAPDGQGYMQVCNTDRKNKSAWEFVFIICQRRTPIFAGIFAQAPFECSNDCKFRFTASFSFFVMLAYVYSKSKIIYVGCR